MFGDGEIKRGKEPVGAGALVYSIDESEFIITRSFHVVPEARDVSSANPQPELTTLEAWELSRAISPRSTVRVATVENGAILNQYGEVSPLTAEATELPWAIYLTDRRHQFRLICLDLDGKTPEAAAAAEADAAGLLPVLTDAGLSPVVCQSGPEGGLHIWIALREGVDAGLVRRLAEDAKVLYTTLDLSPVTNKGYGCARPPGAPHRHGGRSMILTGSLNDLTHPTGTVTQVTAVAEHIAPLAAALIAQRLEDADATDTAQDDGKHPYIPGARQHLSLAAEAALRTNVAGEDASAIMWRILTSAAAAHWHHVDIARLVKTAPGLEHIRTFNDHGRRVPRSPKQRAEILRRQWARAVAYIASGRRAVGRDVTFDDRAQAIAQHVSAVQQRADVSPGRWSSGGGPADRRVLDALSFLALSALKADIEADTRRLALMCGIGRETARTALLRLAEDNWIIRTRAADGPHGAHWKIGPGVVIHKEPDKGRSQTPSAPREAGSAIRNALLLKLQTRIDAAAHDLFTRGGLGIHAGNVYSRCSQTPLSLGAIVMLSGTDAGMTVQTLTQLTEVGVLRLTQHGWNQTELDIRDRAAAARGVSGKLAERAQRYALERELWGWWQAELEWMSTPPVERDRRQAPGQSALMPDLEPQRHPIHPRKYGNRADYRMARRILTGTVQTERPRPVPVSEGERLIIEILGGTPIDTIPVRPAEPERPAMSVSGGRNQLFQSSRPESGRVRFTQVS
ncbi:hypothetical protein [Leucobacter musarum]|uniref:hypothetical protein n=1 Tax=Leucobacter musarum TaxID=1930747 RepID=UPI000AD25D36|nr:hypothetical protein [Leucobacter musarum]